MFLKLILLYVGLAWADDCRWDEVLSKLPGENLLNQETICKGMPLITKESDLRDVLDFFLDENIKNNHKERHEATRKLNKCEPTSESKVLIIAFEGTGAYEPLAGRTLGDFSKCFGGKVPLGLKNKVYSTFKDLFKSKLGRSAKWSGLQSGLQQELAVMKSAHQVDWYSFPSEEVEQLAGLEMLGEISVPKLYDDIKGSVASNPKGISNARDCIKKYYAAAKRLGIRPKVVLTSHSSGGRSLVKFAEHMKKDVSIPIDLAFSIDPVIEAHHAIEEVVPQKIGEPARFLKWKITGGDYPYSAVWSRDHKSKLYKPSNVKDHQSFYQQDDRLGLKMGGDLGRFGIKGSQVFGADNHHIRGLGADAHGPVTYHDTVLESFRNKMVDLLK